MFGPRATCARFLVALSCVSCSDKFDATAALSGAGGAGSSAGASASTSGGSVAAGGAAAGGATVAAGGAAVSFAGMPTVNEPALDTRGLTLSYSGPGAVKGFNASTGTHNSGRQFEVTEEGVSIVDLGVYDYVADGLSGPHAVTLFSLDKAGAGARGTPIDGGSVIVSPGPGAPFDGGFRFAALSKPIDLKPGLYAVVAYGLNAPDPYGDGGSVPLSTTGIRDLHFDPFEVSSNQSPAYPTGGDAQTHSAASFHFKSTHASFIKIMPLGDSLTEGQGSSGGYRLPLAGLLAGRQIAFQFVGSVATNPGTLNPDQLHHEGHTGAMIAAANGRPGIAGSITTYLGPTGAAPDIILLLLGTSDMDLAYLPDSAPDRMDALISSVLDKSLGVAPRSRLIVAQLPTIDDPTTDPRVVKFNAALPLVVARHQAAGEHVSIVDMHSILDGSDFFDRLSPNDAGYAKMARVWLDAIVQP